MDKDGRAEGTVNECGFEAAIKVIPSRLPAGRCKKDWTPRQTYKNVNLLKYKRFVCPFIDDLFCAFVGGRLGHQKDVPAPQ